MPGRAAILRLAGLARSMLQILAQHFSTVDLVLALLELLVLLSLVPCCVSIMLSL